MPMPSYMELTDSGGAKIEGSCQVQGRQGWIEVIEFDHQISLPTDSLQGRTSGMRQHAPFTFVKEFDKSSVKLYKALCESEELQSLKLHWYRIDERGTEVEYFTHELKKVRIISIEPVMYNIYDPRFEAYRHQEKVSVRYREITWTHEGNITHTDNWEAAR